MNNQHVLIRYSDNFAPKSGTIKLHADIIEKYKFVFMGKFGKGVSKNKLSELKKQIKAGVSTFVFLLKSVKGNDKYIVHAGLIEDICVKVDEICLVPEYYASKTNNIKSWFKISQIYKLNPNKILQTLCGSSSKLPIILSLSKSMAGLMYVTLKEGENITDFIEN